MLIENMLYFALGVLVAALLALILLPAVWKRAVRLTKRRIEAATPITMAEFRADKDQLRAEFALTTRRLEMTVDTLRKRLADQLAEFNQKRSDFGAMQAEREQHRLTLKEAEERESTLRGRVAELERDNTDLGQKLRMRERELETRSAELQSLRDGAANLLPVAMAQNRVEAEARISDAELSLQALVAHAPSGDSLAEELSQEAELDALRQKVAEVERTILDTAPEALDETSMRQQLAIIASSVSRLVYAGDSEPKRPLTEESLFDRIQRFADEDVEEASPPPRTAGRRPVGDRISALRE